MQLKFNLISCGIVLGLFVGMLLFVEIGRRLGRRRRESKPGDSSAGAMSAAVFALLGLLLALMFTSSGQRFDARRRLIVDETNAIGTAYRRIDLLPADAQPALKERFRAYVDARLAVYGGMDDEAGTVTRMAIVREHQDEIWNQAVAASRREGVPSSTAMLLLPALNEMLDITTTRTASTQMHMPGLIFAFLIGLALVGALLAGYGTAGSPRDWLHYVTFAAAISVTVYVIIDLEFPRLGLIRVGALDHLLADLRASLK